MKKLAIVGISSVLVAQSTWALGIDQFRNFLKNTPQARGSFTQTVSAKSGRKPQESSGTFAFSRPGKFRWNYDKPYAQLLVSDGKRLWSYDPDLNQVTVRSLGEAVGASPAALLAGEALEDNFTLVDGGSAEDMQFVEAVPASKEGSFQRVRIGLKGELPIFMEVLDNFGQKTVVRFSRIEAMAQPDPDQFKFTPPKGADVIGE